jgi:hypothetical protein
MRPIEPFKNFDGGAGDGSILCAIPTSLVLLTVPRAAKLVVAAEEPFLYPVRISVVKLKTPTT